MQATDAAAEQRLRDQVEQLQEQLEALQTHIAELKQQHAEQLAAAHSQVADGEAAARAQQLEDRLQQAEEQAKKDAGSKDRQIQQLLEAQQRILEEHAELQQLRDEGMSRVQALEVRALEKRGSTVTDELLWRSRGSCLSMAGTRQGAV